MQDAAPAPVRVPLGEASQDVPYYRVNDRAELFDATRLERLLPPVVQAAIGRAELTAAETRALPLFIGSSCFSIGASESRYAAALKQQPQTALPMPFCGYQDIAMIVRNAAGCMGDTYTYNTACTASANALLAATRMLALGWYRHALVIGAELANRTSLAGFAGLQLTADAIRPFDAARDGLVLGEGIGAAVVSIEPGEPGALRIAEGATNCDTSSVTTAHPDGHSVAAVLSQALARAGLEPGEVRGIKAHGTATPTGDSAEAAGLRQVFPGGLPPISVLKPWTGHTLGACGALELALFGGALQQGFMPATPGFETPDPELGVRPLQARAEAPHGYYLLNHFGFGGNNTVLVLEKPA